MEHKGLIEHRRRGAVQPPIIGERALGPMTDRLALRCDCCGNRCRLKAVPVRHRPYSHLHQLAVLPTHVVNAADRR